MTKRITEVEGDRLPVDTTGTWDGSIPEASEGMRFVGFCLKCHDFVELDGSLGCTEEGHGSSSIAVAQEIGADEARPHIPRMNIGALFMPALWGPVHGELYLILYYPAWLFLDNLIYDAVHGSELWPLAIIAAIACAAVTIAYALRANTVGYLRVADRETPAEYVASEKRWAILWVAIGLAFIVLATYFNLVIRPTLG